MQNLSAQAPAVFTANASAGLFSEAQLQLASELVADGQSHLFSDWDAPRIHDKEKQRFMATLLNAHLAYPGGLTAYTRNARLLLAEAAAGANPFDGCTPAQPDLVDLSSFGSDYDAAEAVGLRCFAESAVVLVAGGLGERLGYHGIKLDIPVEVTETTSYLAHYASVIKAASRRLGRAIPLIIMTSRDTDEGTRASLAANKNFGLEAGQITILRQELVPALSDMKANLALEKKYELLLKPHGHGDIHTLLHTSGTAKKLADSGVRYLLFIQDTNGQVFNAALAAIGVSEQRGYDFNSIAVNRIPGEAVGGIARLVRKGAPDLTINVEYNLLDPLLRATVSPEGDVPDASGFSKFPGNINLLIVRLAPYLKVLESSGGVVAEFVNPKFSDGTRTSFKKPARLETLMQDLPKNFTSGEKVGVTVFDRTWCFSACKNNLTDAAQKVIQNGPPESASSAENDFYEAGRTKLRTAGMLVEDGPRQMLRGVPFTTGPRVILRPSFALTLAEVREKIHGGSISGDATLILEGDVRLENATIPEGASLVVHAKDDAPTSLKDFTATSASRFVIQPLTDEEMQSEKVPEYLRIRGYRIVKRDDIS
jgi:UDP-sugar pyrophosphorylase